MSSSGAPLPHLRHSAHAVPLSTTNAHPHHHITLSLQPRGAERTRSKQPTPQRASSRRSCSQRAAPTAACSGTAMPHASSARASSHVPPPPLSHSLDSLTRHSPTPDNDAVSHELMNLLHDESPLPVHRYRYRTRTGRNSYGTMNTEWIYSYGTVALARDRGLHLQHETMDSVPTCS